MNWSHSSWVRLRPASVAGVLNPRLNRDRPQPDCPIGAGGDVRRSDCAAPAAGGTARQLVTLAAANIDQRSLSLLLSLESLSLAPTLDETRDGLLRGCWSPLPAV